MKLGNLAAMLVVPALILTVGCKKPTPVGKWSGNMGNFPATFEFKDGGQTATSFTAMGQSVTLNGTWKTEGEKITTTIASAQPPMAMSFLPANVKSLSGDWKIEGDKLTITATGVSFNLTRVK